MKKIVISLLALSIICCSPQKENEPARKAGQPTVEEHGKRITFPGDAGALKFFVSEKIKSGNLSAQYHAPASVAVSIIQSSERGGRNTVLFDDPELNSAYTQFLQHLININTYKVNLGRVKDLAQHGAATGKEVLDAETQLANEEAAITEQEARLRLSGLDLSRLKDPRRKEAWLICEVPESQIAEVMPGTPCTVTFSAFGNEPFKATVDGIGAEVDNATRMVKVRVVMPNPNNKFEVGMFASVSFVLKEGNAIAIPMTALVNVQGKDYTFVRTSPNTFERRELLTGEQFDSQVVILHGLTEAEEVVTKGTMQLKGLSFGY